MVCPLCGAQLELSLCGLNWNTSGLSRMMRTSCPGFRGSCREGFSHWCRSRSLERPSSEREPGRAATLGLGSGLGPWSALGLLLSRALSSAQAVLQAEAVVPFSRPLAPRDRPTARLSRASRNRRSRSASEDRAPRPASLSAGVTYPSSPRTHQRQSTPFRSHLSL